MMVWLNVKEIKMTELTDLEICTRIAEIEGFTDISVYSGVDSGGTLMVSKFEILTDDGKGFPLKIHNYNPLTDDALCFRLMVKHKIDFVNFDTDMYAGVVKAKTFQNRSPNRAICLSIIEANKE